MTDTDPDESPATAVRLWCHPCKRHVPLRSSRVVREKRKPTVYHVTPNDWAAHRATHTTRPPTKETQAHG